MQISSVGATYAQPQALHPSVSNQASEAAANAAAAAQQAMYGLSTAVGGASEAIMNIAAGQLSNAVDIMA